jgi:hypothetical protein
MYIPIGYVPTWPSPVDDDIDGMGDIIGAEGDV